MRKSLLCIVLASSVVLGNVRAGGGDDNPDMAERAAPHHLYGTQQGCPHCYGLAGEDLDAHRIRAGRRPALVPSELTLVVEFAEGPATPAPDLKAGCR